MDAELKQRQADEDAAGYLKAFLASPEHLVALRNQIALVETEVNALLDRRQAYVRGSAGYNALDDEVKGLREQLGRLHLRLNQTHLS